MREVAAGGQLARVRVGGRARARREPQRHEAVLRRSALTRSEHGRLERRRADPGPSRRAARGGANAAPRRRSPNRGDGRRQCEHASAGHADTIHAIRRRRMGRTADPRDRGPTAEVVASGLGDAVSGLRDAGRRLDQRRAGGGAASRRGSPGSRRRPGSRRARRGSRPPGRRSAPRSAPRAARAEPSGRRRAAAGGGSRPAGRARKIDADDDPGRDAVGGERDERRRGLPAIVAPASGIRSSSATSSPSATAYGSPSASRTIAEEDAGDQADQQVAGDVAADRAVDVAADASQRGRWCSGSRREKRSIQAGPSSSMNSVMKRIVTVATTAVTTLFVTASAVPVTPRNLPAPPCLIAFLRLLDDLVPRLEEAEPAAALRQVLDVARDGVEKFRTCVRASARTRRGCLRPRASDATYVTATASPRRRTTSSAAARRPG